MGHLGNDMPLISVGKIKTPNETIKTWNTGVSLI
jgi:hypothetical protein